ncbi:MAG: hypothetical protein QXO69_01020 [archaeon]
MLLVTTSRKPSKNTRAFARQLANLVPGSVYAPRGKASVDDLASVARSKGLKKIAIVSDRCGNPGKIEFARVSRSSWEWAETLLIKSVSFKPLKSRFDEIRISEELSGLFSAESDDEAEFTAEKKEHEISFSLGGKKLMVIKLKGGK